MSQTYKSILLVCLLIAVISPGLIVAAEENITDEVITRPVIEYKSGKLRDPFETYLTKEAPEVVPQESMDLPKPELDLTKFNVQGIIWGGKVPQAIISNKVVTVGDLIEGAEILSIEKKGITVSFNGAIFDLTAPGQKSVSSAGK